MNSAAHLLPEDRPEFARVLDEALHAKRHNPAAMSYGSAARDPDPSAGPCERLGTEQLRTMALSAATAIAACAAAEYERFVELRTELRDPSNAPSSAGPSGYGGQGGHGDAGRGRPAAGGAAEGGEAGTGLDITGVGALGESVARPADPGAGLVAMASVLVPVLAGTAALIFLVLGYLLRLLLSPEPTVAAPMRGAGWVFALLAVLGTVVAMVGLWRAALRNGPPRGGSGRLLPFPGRRGGGNGDGGDAEYGGNGAAGTGPDAVPDLASRVDAARTAWREALRERGIEPFLREASAEPAEPPEPYESDEPAAPYEPYERAEPYEPEERTPRLGYSGPDLPHFSDRAPTESREEPGRRPRFSSPDFSSPDYGGPDNRPQ